MEPRPRYAAARRTRKNAPAWKCQAPRIGGGLEAVDSLAKGIRTRIVIIRESQQAEVYDRDLTSTVNDVEQELHPA